MSILKSLSLAAALLTFTGCTSSTNSYNDDYFADDFAMQPTQTEQNRPAPELPLSPRRRPKRRTPP